ncbi:TPA: hypothetical protein KQF10_001797 [Clostridioides difficile]|uniref:LuxR C-terminal-related transcriptional regulator n=1 Tax=Clostridioides difficile TaxID=1496 RepID=UPI001C1AA59A|nr:hypothetical protein [Clostridioides difficile]HBF7617530.1 hypothetical protein [Clostridioides difficile]HBG4827216.1 hypothetical protein [Clostridioides difficile]HBH1338311.1 hypothetical protein [Clostridioides difficile]HBZ0256249.1 hypothetical protein [Clostridioides difficile]
MALVNGNFKGKIDNKNIWDYISKLKTLDRKEEFIDEILNLKEIGGVKFSEDKFWQEIFDLGICKANLNTTDILWSNTNISYFLERLGTYLLSKDDKNEEKESIKVYDTYTEFKRSMQQEKKIRKHGEVVEYESGDGEHLKGKPVKILKNQKNFKLAPDVKITKKDRVKYPEIEDYYRYKQYLLDLKNNKEHRKKLAKDKNINNKELKITKGGDVYKFALRQMAMVTDDMLQVKLQKDKNIVWKAPLKDSGNNIIMDCDLIDLFDPVHVKALLQIPYNENLIDEIALSKQDILNKIELTDTQKIILSSWEKGVTQNEIAKQLGIAQKNVNLHIDRIVNKFIDKYTEIYEDEYYYVYLVKGKYKKCSKCGEIKLIQRFDKNGKKGHKSICKACRQDGVQNRV